MVLEVTGMGQVRFGPGFSFLLPREIDRSHRRRGGNVGIRRGLPDFQARWGRGGNSRFEFSPLSTAPHFHSPGSEAPNHRWASFLSAGTRCPRRNFIDELELRNTRPLDPDLLALFLDAKYVEVREGDRLRPGPSTWSSAWAATAKSAFWPVCSASDARTSRSGRTSCAL